MLALVLGGASSASANVGKQKSTHKHINCAANATICTEVWDSEAVFGNEVYTGHDEPSVLFYSNVAGSGNQNQWNVTMPTDPSANHPNKRRQVVHVRERHRVLVRHGHVRHAVVPRD